VLALRWVFCTDLRTDSDFCFIQHSLICFYGRGGHCLLRGAGWFLIENIRLVFRRLNSWSYMPTPTYGLMASSLTSFRQWCFVRFLFCFSCHWKRCDDSQPPVVMVTHRGCRSHLVLYCGGLGFFLWGGGCLRDMKTVESRYIYRLRKILQTFVQGRNFYCLLPYFFKTHFNYIPQLTPCLSKRSFPIMLSNKLFLYFFVFLMRTTRSAHLIRLHLIVLIKCA